MGVLLAKFRKEKTTEEVLEKLEERLQTLESYMHNTEEQKKRFVGNFLAISIGIYVITIIVVYFRFYPSSWKDCLLYFVPLMLVPFVIFRLRRVFTWYFQRKLNDNSDKLVALRSEKRKILEQVMDKETYKVAVNLLARFGDKGTKPTFGLTPRPQSSSLASSNALRLRNVPNITTTTTTTSLSSQLSSLRATNNASLTGTPRRPILSPSSRLGGGTETVDGNRLSVFDENRGVSWSRSPTSTNTSPTQLQLQATRSLARQTPFPIINHREKSVFDKIVDVLIGDGPQDRFALICKECHAHNGMAPKDEFQYVAFRCAFCAAMNPARKERPIAPRLSMPLTTHGSSTESSSSDEGDTVIHRMQTRKFSEVSQGPDEVSMDVSNLTADKVTSEDATMNVSADSCDNNNESADLKQKIEGSAVGAL